MVRIKAQLGPSGTTEGLRGTDQRQKTVRWRYLPSHHFRTWTWERRNLGMHKSERTEPMTAKQEGQIWGVHHETAILDIETNRSHVVIGSADIA